MLVGLFFGALLAIFSWWVLHVASGNLPGLLAISVPAGIAAIAFLIGLVAGSAVWRRGANSKYQLGLFSGVAVGFAGGLVGFLAVAVLTVTYLITYATWPDSWFQDALVLLSVPVLGAVGFCAGGLIGLVLGTLTGGVIRLGRGVKQ